MDWIHRVLILIVSSLYALGYQEVLAQQTIPVLVCAGIGGNGPTTDVPANTPVVLDMTYLCTLTQPSGMVTFSSSDSLATLAPPLMYGVADVVANPPPTGGWLFSHTLLATFTFRSVGPQTLVVSLPGNPFSPISVPIIVDPLPVPVLGPYNVVLLGILIGVSAIYLRCAAGGHFFGRGST